MTQPTDARLSEIVEYCDRSGFTEDAAIARELLRWRREAQRLIRMTKDLAGDKYGGDGPNHYGLAKEVHDGLAECLRMIEPQQPNGQE
jgi:hypothetical protein